MALWQSLAAGRFFQQHDRIHANHRRVFAFARGRHIWILTMRHPHPAYQPNRNTGAKIGALTLLVLTAGLLGGCETNGGPSNPLSELVAYNSGAQASAQAPARQETARPPEKPKTRAQAAMDCWAAAEKSHASASLEARADFVNKCIDSRLKTPEAKTDSGADAKPAAAPKPRQRTARPAS